MQLSKYTHPQGTFSAVITHSCSHLGQMVFSPTSTAHERSVEKAEAQRLPCFECDYLCRVTVVRKMVEAQSFTLSPLYGVKQAVELAEAIRLECLTDVLASLGANDATREQTLRDPAKMEYFAALVGLQAWEWIEMSRHDRTNSEAMPLPIGVIQSPIVRH